MMERTETTRQYARCCVCYDLIPAERRPGVPQFCGPECSAEHDQRLDSYYLAHKTALDVVVQTMMEGPLCNG